MMAAIDAESDSDLPAPLASDRAASTQARPTSILNQGEDSGSSNSDNAFSENIPDKRPAPRGKLAARLQGQVAASLIDTHNDSSDDGDAYSRIKKSLASRYAKNPIQAQNPDIPPVPEGTDEEDDSPAVMRRRKASSPAASNALQSSSPGLFITPEKDQRLIPPVKSPSMTHRSPCNSSDSDLPADPQANSRFLALVARKRVERQKKAKAEEEKKAKRRARFLREEMGGRDSHVDMMRRSSEESDVGDTRKLTQHTRPTRKASKKALEEMNRETQRMSRNMQLAHQARTRKRITKESLFARFNFRTANSAGSGMVQNNSSSAAASSNPVSDADARPSAETPPTSPVARADEISKTLPTSHDRTSLMNDEAKGESVFQEEDLPDAQHIIIQSQEQLEIRRARAVEHSKINDVPTLHETKGKGKGTTRKQIRVRLPKPAGKANPSLGSESDLEILPTNKTSRKADVFDRLPAAKAAEGRSLQKLRALAHLTSPGKRAPSSKAGMSMLDMQSLLQKRARQQAARERAEKIQELKDRGIIIQTAEEREKDLAEVEDLLEKARREAAELKQQEKDESKKQAKANGQANASDVTSGEDEDYQENDADESDIELSGSDEEGHNRFEGNSSGEDFDGPEGVHEDPSRFDGGLIQDEASETSDESEEDEGHDEEAETFDVDGEQVSGVPMRRRKTKVIFDEDDEETEEGQEEAVPSTQTMAQPLIDPGLPFFAGVPMGLTQAFAATMADTQTQAYGLTEECDQEQDSLAFLGAPPEPEFPVYDWDGSPQVIVDSQEVNGTGTYSQAKITLDFSQSQLQETDAEPAGTQMSEIPDPTQDVGFTLSSPAPRRFASIPPSTVDTVVLPHPQVTESPVVKRRGRLRRKTDIAVDDEPVATADAEQEWDDMVISANAFDVLKKRSKKPPVAPEKFDKKRSNAHEMVEEQAQESEDEFAGLGGASDEDSGGEIDEEVQKMIEQGEVDVDERQLAAFYA